MSVNFAIVFAWLLRAAGPGPDASAIRIAAATCPGLEVSEVKRLVQIELADVLAQVRSGPPLVIAVQCEGAKLVISVHDPVTSKRLERTLPSPPDELGRERVVALAIAQLFAASWLELLLDHDESQQSHNEDQLPAQGTLAATVAAAEELAEAAIRPRPAKAAPYRTTLDLGVGLGVRGRALERSAFPAMHLDVQLRAWLTRDVGLSGRIGFDYGEIARTSGAVQALDITAGGGVAWRTRPRRAVALGGAVLLSGAWASLRGRPSGNRTRGRPNRGPTGQAVLTFGPRIFARRFRVDFDAELGGMLRSPEGLVEGEPSTTMGGFFVGSALRVSFALGPERSVLNR